MVTGVEGACQATAGLTLIARAKAAYAAKIEADAAAARDKQRAALIEELQLVSEEVTELRRALCVSLGVESLPPTVTKPRTVEGLTVSFPVRHVQIGDLVFLLVGSTLRVFLTAEVDVRSHLVTLWHIDDLEDLGAFVNGTLSPNRSALFPIEYLATSWDFEIERDYAGITEREA